MLGFGASMEANAGALRYILNDRQQPLKLWGLGDGNVVAESGYLIADALEGVAVPSSVDNQPTGNGGALGLISN